MLDGLGDLHCTVLGVLAHALDFVGKGVIKLKQDFEEHRSSIEVPAKRKPLNALLLAP